MPVGCCAGWGEPIVHLQIPHQCCCVGLAKKVHFELLDPVGNTDRLLLTGQGPDQPRISDPGTLVRLEVQTPL